MGGLGWNEQEKEWQQKMFSRILLLLFQLYFYYCVILDHFLLLLHLTAVRGSQFLLLLA